MRARKLEAYRCCHGFRAGVPSAPAPRVGMARGGSLKERVPVLRTVLGEVAGLGQ